MTESGLFRTPPLHGWQRADIVAAGNCLREQTGRERRRGEHRSGQDRRR